MIKISDDFVDFQLIPSATVTLLSLSMVPQHPLCDTVCLFIEDIYTYTRLLKFMNVGVKEIIQVMKSSLLLLQATILFYVFPNFSM